MFRLFQYRELLNKTIEEIDQLMEDKLEESYSHYYKENKRCEYLENLLKILINEIREHFNSRNPNVIKLKETINNIEIELEQCTNIKHE